jgi:hypothetical protein
LISPRTAVGAALVQNPSFESGWNETWPHYGAVENWAGATGVNDRSLDKGGPFHDNGLTPDGTKVGFKQQTGDVSQDIYGLTPGQAYWIQFFYNTRGDVQSGSCDITTRFNGVDLDTVTGIQRAAAPEGAGAITAPFYARSVAFTPDTDSGTLTFHVGTVGDRTALFDAVTIVPAEASGIVVMNPSFEASGILPAVGLRTTPIAGWAAEGTYGVDTAGGTYADNGMVPEQDLVAFLEGPGSLTQTVKNLVPGTQYKLKFAFNARTGNTPHLQVMVDGAVAYETDVTPVGGANEFRTQEVTFTPTTNFAALSFVQSKAGTDALLIDDVRLTGQTATTFPPLQISPSKAVLSPGQTVVISVTVPSEKLAVSDADIVLTSSDLNVLALLGAGADGKLVLHFAKGGPTVQTAEALAVKRGNAAVTFPEASGLSVPGSVLVSVVESFVRNPSFEAEQSPSGNGYGAVLSWASTGQVGLNRIDQPFAADSGTIPDRLQVAFIQGVGSLSQEITSLTPGATYWLQFSYSLRDIADPAGPAADLIVKLGGNTLVTIGPIVPLSQSGSIAYYTTNVVFSPTNAIQTLEFITGNTKGDASLLIDAVSITRREPEDMVVQNPSFEASGAMDLYIEGPNTAPLSGWTITQGGHGTASGGPFADNGTAPDQDQVLFLQNSGSASQTVAGFTVGQKYTVVFSVNNRGCCGDAPLVTHYVISVGAPGVATSLFEEDITPVGGTAAYYRRAVVFTADYPEQDIKFEHMASGDRSLLLDNIRVIQGEVGEPPSPTIGVSTAGVQVAWPSPSTGYVLQSAPSPNGPWILDPAPVTTVAGKKVATVNATESTRYFRLAL